MGTYVVTMATSDIASDRLVFRPVPGVHDRETAIVQGSSDVCLSAVCEFAFGVDITGIL